MSICELIIVGAIGGAAAALTATVTTWLVLFLRDRIHMATLYTWLKGNPGKTGFRSTRAIASWNNMTEDRVRNLCARSTKIYLSTGEKPDMWGTKPRAK